MEEAMDLAEAMNQKMASFVQVHNDTVQDYEEKLKKLASTNDRMNRERLSDDDRSTTLRALKEENELLRVQSREAESHFTQEDSPKLQKINAEMDELREENEALRAKLDEAKEVEEGYKQELMEFDAENDAIYRTCVGLQKEIDLLQRKAEYVG
mmetsp:Transcript_93/g.139  ORF Transcript_93/g.139 Transcript_93/m.139 type:complete len:154 (+) Transcript_93:1-462(+)